MPSEPFLRRKARNRSRPVHRHRWLLEAVHHRAERSAANLRSIVRGTEQFKKAEAEGKLIRLPTGDGGALVFRNHPEAPVLCALEISKALKSHPELKVRMGIHSGPVNEITDLKRAGEYCRRRNQHRAAGDGLRRCRTHSPLPTCGGRPRTVSAMAIRTCRARANTK